MTLKADLFWSCRSPYSYIAVPRYRALVAEHDLEIRLRPVLPIAIREPDFFEKRHPNWLRYTLTDVIRLATYHGMPISMPQPDPIIQDLETREIAEEQPHVHRLTRLVQAAARMGKGLDYAAEMGRIIWGGTKDWHEGSAIDYAAARCNIDPAELNRMVQRDEDGLDREIEANAILLEESGHWGVPTFVFDGEAFFGQDRVELAQWRMERAGLKQR
ncbi:2-hydroxychromene-2-carboxylate isomerase [Sphingomicrobium flavum]|uniref:2-hydroxychromene-2-carboxylate isomerase n=1 Tax=Sphingomicrobium flavum TaxID=1229164 RepID=UPI0021ADD84B|nr:DsbA family protein [Sphingomicrobium flavum]